MAIILFRFDHIFIFILLIYKVSVNASKAQFNKKSLSTIKSSQYASADISKLSGCWQVIETGSKEPSWKKYSDFLGRLGNKSNRNFQFFSENSNSFVNLSEYTGNKFYAYTNGSYEVIDKKRGILAASVSSIFIVFFFLRFRINVNGKGKSNSH